MLRPLVCVRKVMAASVHALIKKGIESTKGAADMAKQLSLNNDDEIALINAFRALPEEERLFVLLAVIGKATTRVRIALDNLMQPGEGVRPN
jgi:hypothetical protein